MSILYETFHVIVKCVLDGEFHVFLVLQDMTRVKHWLSRLGDATALVGDLLGV